MKIKVLLAIVLSILCGSIFYANAEASSYNPLSNPENSTLFLDRSDNNYHYIGYWYESEEIVVKEKSKIYTLIYHKTNNDVSAVLTFSEGNSSSLSIGSTVSVGTGAKIEYFGMGVETSIELSSSLTHTNTTSFAIKRSEPVLKTEENGYYYAVEVYHYATLYVDVYDKYTNKFVEQRTYKNMLVKSKMELGFSKTEPTKSALILKYLPVC